MIKAILFLLFFASIFSIYMGFRSIWIDQVRKDIKLADPAIYDRLPPMRVMIDHFWILDVSKFIDFKGIDYKEKEILDKKKKKEKQRQRGQSIIDRINKQ